MRGGVGGSRLSAPYLPEVTYLPSGPLPDNELVPATPHNATSTPSDRSSIRQAQARGVQEDTLCHIRRFLQQHKAKPLKATNLVTHPFPPPKAGLYHTATYR